MKIKVKFWSYFKEHTQCTEVILNLPEAATLGEAYDEILRRFPVLSGMKNCTLKAVGLNYQMDDFRLSEGDEISLFPPVQGG